MMDAAKIIDGGHELARRLRTDWRECYAAWPAEAEIATLDTADPVEMMAAACRLNARYRDGWHASAIIAGFVHADCLEPLVEPALRGAGFAHDTPELLADLGVCRQQLR